MQENNRDFDSVLKCLSNNRGGIECLREDEKFLKSLVSLFSAIKPTKKRPDAIEENEYARGNRYFFSVLLSLFSACNCFSSADCLARMALTLSYKASIIISVFRLTL